MLILRLIHRILVGLNVLFALLLVLTYVSVYINPEDFWFAALYGLLYPFFLIVNLLFLFYWIFRWRKLVFISFAAILLGVSHFNGFIRFPYGGAAKGSNPDLRVMTYNVNLFRLYSWSKLKPSYSDVFNYIKNNSFDVVCLQEFYLREGRLTLDQAKQQSGMNIYPSYILRRSNSAYGLAILTNLPVVRTGEISFPNSFNACMYADIVKGADTIRVYNLHLQSTRLKERNFNFLLRNEFKLDSKNYDELKDLLSRLGVAFTKRARQVNMVVEHMRTCRYPIIICGDFNDSPVSYTYHTLTASLHDTFKDAGSGVVVTFSGLWPSYRIDYVLRSRQFRTVSYQSPRLRYSDHYPVVVEVQLSGKR